MSGDRQEFESGHRQYLQWGITVNAEATTDEDVEFIQHMIVGAPAKLVAELSGRQPSAISHGPDKVLDLSTAPEPTQGEQ